MQVVDPIRAHQTFLYHNFVPKTSLFNSKSILIFIIITSNFKSLFNFIFTDTTFYKILLVFVKMDLISQRSMSLQQRHKENRHL